MRSSERLHRWLVEHPTFGAHISDYLAGRGLRKRTKAVAISTLWASVGVSTLFFVPLIVADIIIVTVAVAVTIYLLRLPTCAAEPADKLL